MPEVEEEKVSRQADLGGHAGSRLPGGLGLAQVPMGFSFPHQAALRNARTEPPAALRLGNAQRARSC